MHVTFDGVQISHNIDFTLRILDLPNPAGCNESITNELKNLLLSCSLSMDYELSQWIVTYTFSKPCIHSCINLHHHNVSFSYETRCAADEKKDTYLVEKIIADWRGLVKIYEHAFRVDDTLSGNVILSSYV